MIKNFSPLQLAGLCLSLFIIVALPIALGLNLPGDEAMLQAALSWRTAPLTYLIQLLAFISSAVPAALICATITGYELWRVRRIEATWALIALAGSTLSNIGLRILIGRLPPQVETIGNLLPEIQASFHRYSFPSGHAGTVIIAYLSLALLLWPTVRFRWLTATLTLAVILGVGVGRFYLGVHWPSDVLGGYLLALTWWLVGVAVRQRYNASHVRPPHRHHHSS